MMAAIFAILTAGLAVGWWGQRRLSILLIVLALSGAIVLFLWEVYSPETGFGMPWLRT